MATYPCSDDPSEIIEAVVGAGDAAEKFDKFVNGGVYEEVQLGAGQPTPTLRNVVHLVKSAAATLDGSDVSGKLSDAANGGTTLRTLSERFGDLISPKDFGAAGDGTTDDTAAFNALETAVGGKFVNLGGASYLVEQIPADNFYYNGYFIVDDNNIETETTEESLSPIEVLNGKIHISEGVINGFGAGPLNWVVAGDMPSGFNPQKHYCIYSFGVDNFKSIDEDISTHSCIAIGPGIMSNGQPGNFNIGVGDFALHNVNGDGSKSGDRNIAVGSLALFGLTTGRHNIAVGRDCLSNVETGSDNIAIGYRAVAGMGGLCNLDGEIYTGFESSISSNTGLGFYSGSMLTGSASYNTFVGNGAAKNIKTASGITAVGSGALLYNQFGMSPNGREMVSGIFFGTYDQTGYVVTITTTEKHNFTQGEKIHIVFSDGALSVEGENIISQNNEYNILEIASIIDDNSFTVISVSSRTVQSSLDNKCTIHSFTGSYFQSGTTITITMPRHEASVNGHVVIVFLGGELDPATHGASTLLYVNSVSENEFTIVSPNSLYTEGYCYVTRFETSKSLSLNSVKATAVGANAGRNIKSVADSLFVGFCAGNGKQNYIVDPDKDADSDSGSEENVVANSKVTNSSFIGASAGFSVSDADRCNFIGTGSGYLAENPQQCDFIGAGAAGVVVSPRYSVAIGCRSCRDAATLESSVSVGRLSGAACTENSYNVFVGMSAGNRPAAISYSTAVGFMAMHSDSDSTAFQYSTAIGAYSTVSGSNQLQLGSSGVTTYAYGAVQDRSDARDKTDVRDTVLGLDFIRALRPVDFRWDYRDAYIDFVEEDGELKAVEHEKDGSRKRTRFHHGLIAQEVKAILDEQGIDFGGYQDHKVNGGKDVLTLGYEEFIGPIIKALQEIDARLSALEV